MLTLSDCQKEDQASHLVMAPFAPIICCFIFSQKFLLNFFNQTMLIQMKEKERSTKGISAKQMWSKLSMEPVVKLKRIKVSFKPVVMLKRIEVIESKMESDDSEYDTDDLLADSGDEDLQFTQVKPATASHPSGHEWWCEGMLVWARVQGYPFWPAVIVKEQRS